MKKQPILFIVLLIGLFLFRLLFGLASEFWFDDELQIYLIGLKSFTTHTWPYFGPDVVYTNSQIPGALQGLLIALPLYILPLPETPTIFLNILSFLSLSFFAWFICKRFPGMPKWLIWTWTLTCPWIMNFSTRVVNPSYAVIFSIPFFVCFFDMVEAKKTLINKQWALLIMGICTTFIMQLHLSWILLIPFAGWALWLLLKSGVRTFIAPFLLYILGVVIGSCTLIPTYLQHTVHSVNVSHNIVFNISNYSNLFVILAHYLGFATFEIPYMLGCDNAERFAVVKQNIWMAPVILFLLPLGWIQNIFLAVAYFRKKDTPADYKINRIMLVSFLIVFISFFFSIKGPSPHTFFILWPIPFFYSFYAYQWLFSKKIIWYQVFKVAVLSGLLFHLGLGLYNLNHRSMYTNRPLVEKAINQKDYKILGTRRADKWGYGY